MFFVQEVRERIKSCEGKLERGRDGGNRWSRVLVNMKVYGGWLWEGDD